LSDELQESAAQIKELMNQNDSLNTTVNQFKKLVKVGGSSDALMKREQQGLERKRSYQRTKRADNQHKARVSGLSLSLLCAWRVWSLCLSFCHVFFMVVDG
jgi:peptidoglycan hydrolase CwlO-like protein